jgi:hypothetical protein
MSEGENNFSLLAEKSGLLFLIDWEYQCIFFSLNAFVLNLANNAFTAVI